MAGNSLLSQTSLFPHNIKMQVNRYDFENGLRLVHSPDKATAMVALAVTYRAGSGDEQPVRTGLAHLAEHMMFAGSANIGDFDGELSAAGGESNAFTTAEYTTYYDTLPAVNAETAFRLESDRMLSPSFGASALDVQRAVVIEEFKQQCLNRPYGDAAHHLLPLMYDSQNPCSWPTIGIDPGHIAGATRDDLVQWANDFYMPGNAVLAVTGNIEFDRAVALARKWFGDIPSRPRAVRPVRQVRPLDKPVVKQVSGNVPAVSVMAAYHMAAYGTRQAVAADALTDLLADGRASRYVSRFVSDPSSGIVEADASINVTGHSGLMHINAKLAGNVDPLERLGALTGTVLDIARDGVDGHTLQRLKNKRRASHLISYVDYVGRAQNLSVAVHRGEDADTALDQYLKLTSDDIAQAAQRIVADANPGILIYSPVH